MTEAAPWPERALHMVCSFKGAIWVMGGQSNAPVQSAFIAGTAGKYEKQEERGGELRDVWCSTDGKDWTLVTDSAPWGPRGMITGANGGVAVHQGMMWILGGGHVGPHGVSLSSLKYWLPDQPRMRDRLYYNDVWCSADGVEWTRRLERAPWDARSYHDVATFDGRLWVLAGCNTEADSLAQVGVDGNMNDVWHSADGVSWEQLGTGPSFDSSTPWAIRHAMGVFVQGNALYIAAGNACVYPREQIDNLRNSYARGEYNYQPQSFWLPPDVWRLKRKGIGRGKL
eukprot:SAG31_NODE_2996_length_4803_cov_8.948342_7_plen_284_part_00